MKKSLFLVCCFILTFWSIKGFAQQTKHQTKQTKQQQTKAQTNPQSAEEQQRTEARGHYTTGTKLFNEGDISNALSEFETAYNLSPHPIVLISIANCLERLGRITETIEKLELYLQNMPQAQDRAQIEQRIADLRIRPSKVNIISQPSGATITLDGNRLTEITPYIAEVSSGDHAIALELEGYQLTLREFHVTSGEESTIDVQMISLSETTTQQTEETTTQQTEETTTQAEEQQTNVDEILPEDEGPRITVPVWVSLGIFAASFISGVVTGSLALSDQSEFDDGGQIDQDIADSGQMKALIADVSFGVAAASAITGIILFFVQNSRSDSDENESSVSIVPGISNDGVGVFTQFNY